MEEARLDQGSRLMELIGPWLAPVGDDRGVERTGEVGGRVRMAEVVGLLWSASGDSQARAGARRLGSRVGEGLADGPGGGGGQDAAGQAGGWGRAPVAGCSVGGGGGGGPAEL